MKKRKRSKKSLVLFGLLYLILIAVIGVLGGLCYLSFDLNNGMKKNIAEIKTETEGLSVKIGELETLSEELDIKIAEQQAAAKAEEEAQEENGMLHPSSGDGVFGGMDSVENLQVGQVIDEFAVIGNEENYFRAYEITEGDRVYNRINGCSYYANHNIGLSDLRYLKLVHYNFNGEAQVGELIVNAALAEDVINIFEELFYEEYEIESMRLIDDYWTGDGDSSDYNSIEHNNTSAFCYREVTGGGDLSNHAFGRAIDINPQQNPYVSYYDGQPYWSHENASAYIDRASGEPHMVVENDVCYNIFTKYGFSWGGHWSGIKDYQHFEKE